MDPLLALVRPWLLPAFSLWGSAVTWLEIIAFVLSVVMVWCNIRVRATAWPLAIASSLLYGLLFADARMYGEAGLQLVFVLVAGWGWWQWLRGTGTDGQPLRVRRLSRNQRARIIGLILGVWPLLGWLLDTHTDSDVPWWDALPTTASLAGQWLLGRKYMENWPVWILVNVVSIALFAYKELWLTVVLYALFTVMAWFGWQAWRQLSVDSAPA